MVKVILKKINKTCICGKAMLLVDSQRIFCDDCRKKKKILWNKNNRQRLNYLSRKRYHTPSGKIKHNKRIKKYIKSDKGIKTKRLYSQNNQERIKELRDRYFSNPKNKKRKREANKKYREKNKEKIKLFLHKWRKDNKIHIRKWRKDNIDKIRNLKKKYSKLPHYKEYCRVYVKNRSDKDLNYRITCRLRKMLNGKLRYYIKEGKIMPSRKYGINYEKIIKHLKPFPKDLSNYHIDHIRPLCSFTFVKEDGTTNLEEIKKAFAPNNLQWLTAKENLSKGGKWDD
ncbi:MAG: hypothetical protein KKF48_02700 [Nanoarchaeota archaeon]|nr:hypothetical protein [Nanoarchaeota archaeon]MBU1027931.1 hypothetical protein [Nanoarchaeota archaeon]